MYKTVEKEDFEKASCLLPSMKTACTEEKTGSDIDELNDLIGNLHPYCYELEKDASESSGSNSDTNEEESSEEENVSRNNVEINRAEHKDWCIYGRCNKEIREIDCLCCQEVKNLC